MARSSSSNKIQYTCNGVSTVFAYDFPMQVNTNCVVIKTSTLGVETTLSMGTHYTVSINTDVHGDPISGGNVTMLTAPLNGEKLTIKRIVPITQIAEWQNGAAIDVDTFEDALDKVTDILVQDAEILRRIPTFKPSTTFLDKQFPELVAGKAIRVSDDGLSLICSTNDFDTLLQDTTTQANLAIAAKNSSDATAALVLTQYNTVVADAAQVAADKAIVAADKATVISDMNTVAADKAIVAADKATVISDMNTVAADKAIVAADKATVIADMNTVAADKAIVIDDMNTVASDKAIVAADKATVIADMNTVASDKAIVASDKAIVAADKALASDWAQKTTGTVDGTGYSAKYWAQQSQAAANVYTFSNVAVSGQTTIEAEQNSDTITFAAGSNITLTTNPTTDTLTVAVSGLGTAAALDVGTTANKVVQLDGSAQLPSVSGVNVTNVNAAQLGGYTIGVGANGILQLNGSSQIPAVSGALVTNLNGSNIASGTVPTARLGSGTASSSTYLRGDSSWAAIDLSTKVNLAGDTMTGQLVGTTFKSNGTTATSSGFKIANGNDLGTLYKDISYSAVQSGVGAGYTTAVTVSGTVMTITTNCNLCPNCNYQPACNCNCCC